MEELTVSVNQLDVVISGKERLFNGDIPQRTILAVNDRKLLVGTVHNSFFANGEYIDMGSKVPLMALPDGSYDLTHAVHTYRIVDGLLPGLRMGSVGRIIDITTESDEKKQGALIERVARDWAYEMVSSELLRGILRFGARQFMRGVLSGGYDPVRLNELCTALDERGIAYDRRRIDELNELNLQHAQVMYAAVNGYPAPFTRNTSI